MNSSFLPMQFLTTDCADNTDCPIVPASQIRAIRVIRGYFSAIHGTGAASLRAKAWGSRPRSTSPSRCSQISGHTRSGSSLVMQ